MPRLLLVLQVYLGRLRESEVERITERFHHGIVEICLTLTVFRQDFDARLVILMGVLAMVKVFHWLIQDRINYIQTESSIAPLQHLRIVAFLSILTVRFCFVTIAACVPCIGFPVQYWSVTGSGKSSVAKLMNGQSQTPHPQ